MSKFHREIVVAIKNEFNGEVITDFSPPLSSEKMVLLRDALQDVEEAIECYYSRLFLSDPSATLPDNCKLNQERNAILQLIQNNAEWHEAHSTH